MFSDTRKARRVDWHNCVTEVYSSHQSASVDDMHEEPQLAEDLVAVRQSWLATAYNKTSDRSA
jgi:hypothetical protein